MIIKAIPSGPFQTNAYIIACENSRLAVIIDPSPDSFDAIVRFLKESNLSPDKIVLTHSHWDHFADAAKLKKHYNIPIYIHKEDEGNLKDPGSDQLPCWIAIERADPDCFLNEGDKIPVGLLNFLVIHTPGHTPGGICLYNEENKILISGDTLFKGSIGNLSFPTAEQKRMWESLQKLEKLPKETVVYPGHGSKTTIGAESWLKNAEQIFGG